MTSNNVTIRAGENILTLRKSLHMQQSELARKGRISKTYLGEIERGLRTNVSISAIQKIAAALDVPLSKLLEEDKGNPFDSFAYDFQRKRIEEACYPPGFGSYPATTLLQFFTFLPLLDPQELLRLIMEFYGDSERSGNAGLDGSEAAFLHHLNSCISKIPSSPEKEYAEMYARYLSRAAYMVRKNDSEDPVNEDAGRAAYIAKIRRSENFIKAFRRIAEMDIWTDRQ